MLHAGRLLKAVWITRASDRIKRVFTTLRLARATLRGNVVFPWIGRVDGACTRGDNATVREALHIQVLGQEIQSVVGVQRRIRTRWGQPILVG